MSTYASISGSPWVIDSSMWETLCKDKETCLRKNGLIKCSIVTPERLYHPVLPFRANFLSVPNMSPNLKHRRMLYTTDEERDLTGTWVIDEVWLAVQMGCMNLEIHELYEYNVTRYETETREGVLFAGYIDTFLNLKAEANGYSACVRSPANEERFIESFWKSEWIRLDKESIRSNAAKRGLANLCLNSMWGN